MGGINGWVLTKNAPAGSARLRAPSDASKENQTMMAGQGSDHPGRNGRLPASSSSHWSSRPPSSSPPRPGIQNFLDQDLGPAVGRVVNDVSVEIVSGQMSAEDAAQQIQDAWALDHQASTFAGGCRAPKRGISLPRVEVLTR